MLLIVAFSLLPCLSCSGEKIFMLETYGLRPFFFNSVVNCSTKEEKNTLHKDNNNNNNKDDGLKHTHNYGAKKNDQEKQTKEKKEKNKKRFP